MNSLELREQRAALVTDSRKLYERAEAEGRELTSEEEEQWATRMRDVDKLENQIKAAERKEKLEALESDMNRSQGRKVSPSASAPIPKNHTKQERNKALKAWMAYGSGRDVSVSGDTIQRANDLGYHLNNHTITMRSINTGTSTAGGNTTFTTTYPDLQTEMKYYSPIIGQVDVQVTSDGNNFTLPRGSDVANTMSIIGQTSASPTNVDPTFDKVTLGGYYFRTIVQVTYEMLEDAVFDVESWLVSRLAERGARTLEKYIVSGTGSSQPTGLIAACTSADGGTPAVTLAATHKNFYTFDDLMTLFSSVDLAYRPTNTLVLADSSVWDLRRIKDGQNRYIWDVNNTLVQNMQPDKIAGFNYLISNSIDASGSFSKNIAVFANLSRHVVRMVDGVKITRLNELYRANGMIGFEVLMRFDCNYVGHASSIARAATPAS
ncbi:phage major capsid protein [Fimbriiglobus ruber]|uniref:Phage major capsid protein n=1 Tax=Fimbriiglobus ruber TaxID=1908690 RepID=A0A225DE32_9BACT|nr:phage major capsid protein [Fimbriiglobus ruber]OWK37894.1 Phage major capsid protein [Fimbriiglobus ruber]